MAFSHKNVSLTLDAKDFSAPVIGASLDIADYLNQMRNEYDAGCEQCMFLPSLMSLSECFHCSAVDVHQALMTLKEQGCDFFIMGFESPITLWYPNRIQDARFTA